MKNITIISGGTATNHILDAFNLDSEEFTISYILPVSDNGGSSSEIIRVLGGCAIGDIRSRLVRLIPDSNEYKKINGVKELLSYRLSNNKIEAKYEWSMIVDGTHFIWKKVESRLKVLLLSFLIHVDMEIHKRSKLCFNFELASIGNLFLTGARLFFGDLDSGIELISRICRINENIDVSGCLNTNFTYHIAAILENGEIIRGQSQISHPSVNNDNNDNTDNNCNISNMRNLSVEDLVNFKEENTQTSNNNNINNNNNTDDELIHPSLESSQLHFEKNNIPPLNSKIKRLFYISPYGEEIHPKASKRTIDSFNKSDIIIYSIGSLWTSIIPVLLLRGVGEEIIKKENKIKIPKVLLVNSEYDRETFGLNINEFIKIIVTAICYSIKNKNINNNIKIRDVVTDIVYSRDGDINITSEECEYLEAEGVKCHCVGTKYLESNDVKVIINSLLQ